MGIMFNPCQPCCDNIQCIVSDCCECVPQLKMTWHNDILIQTGAPPTNGQLYIPNISHTSIELEHVATYNPGGNPVPQEVLWGGGLALARVKRCGEYAQFHIDCDEFVLNTSHRGIVSGFRAHQYAQYPDVAYHEPYSGNCDESGTNFGLYFSGENKWTRWHDDFRKEIFPLGGYQGDFWPVSGDIWIQYGTAAVSAKQSCCPYIWEEEQLDIMCCSNYVLSGTLTNYNTHFSGSIQGSPVVLECKSYTPRVGTLSTAYAPYRGWTSYWGTGSSNSNLYYEVQIDDLHYGKPSVCYPFILRGGTTVFGDFAIVRRDSQYPSGVPTFVTDARRIPRTLYGDFQRIGSDASYSGDAITLQSVELNWEEGTRNWVPGTGLRCVANPFPPFEPCLTQNNQWVPEIYRTTCAGVTGIFQFGPILRISNAYENPTQWSETLNKGNNVSPVGSGECKEYSFDMQLHINPTRTTFTNIGIDLVSGWNIKSIDPFMAEALYQHNSTHPQKTRYICNGDYIRVEITE